MTSSRKPVLLLAETGFIIRNLLLGYFADEISKSRKLLVAVKDPRDKNLLELIEGKNIELIDFPFEPYNNHKSLLHRLFSWDNLMYNFRMVVKDNESLRLQTILFEGSDAQGKAAMVNTFFQKLGKFAHAAGLSNSIEDIYLGNYISKKPIVKQWEILLEKYDPAVVFSSMLTHSVRYRCSTDLPIMVAAHNLNIKTCTLVQSWDNLSSKTCVLPHWLDRYFTWSQTMTEELLQFNPRIKRDKISIVGSPQYDFHLDEDILESRDGYLNSIGLNPDRRYIVIGTGTAKWMPDEMKKMISLCKEVHRQLPDVQCLIRLHPKDHGERWEPFKNLLKENSIILQHTSPPVHMDQGGFIPPKDFYKDQINTIFHAALVINSSSSITVDAAILNTPIICIAYDLTADRLFPQGRALTYSRSAHYSKLTATGGVWVVHSEADCIDAIATYLQNHDLHKSEREKIVETVAADVRSKAGVKLAREVDKLTEA